MFLPLVTIYHSTYIQPKKQFKVQIIGILEEKDTFIDQKCTSFFSQETVPKASLPSSHLSTKKSSSNCLSFVHILVKTFLSLSCPDLYFLRVRSSVSLKGGRLVTRLAIQLRSTGMNTHNFWWQHFLTPLLPDKNIARFLSAKLSKPQGISPSFTTWRFVFIITKIKSHNRFCSDDLGEWRCWSSGLDLYTNLA